MRKFVVFVAVVVAGLLAWRFGIPALSSWSQQTSSTPSAAVASAQKNEAGKEAMVGAGTPVAAHPEASVRPVADGSSASAAPQAGSTFEAGLLTGGAVNERGLKMLESKDFDRVLDQLDAQNAGRSNALAGKYRGQIEGTLASFGKDVQLDRLACGSNVCMGTVRSGQSKSFSDWYENVQTAATIPMGALAEFPVKLPGGGIEHRILFTTQPGSAAVMVPPMPRPQHS